MATDDTPEATRASKPAPEPTEGDDSLVPTCSCGHDRNHYMVSPHCKYSGWGWFWVTVMGVSKTPIKATFRCRKCGEVVEETTDPEILANLT